MTNPRPLVLLAAVGLLALTGCVAGPTVSESGYVLLVASAPPETHLLALIDGELSLKGDCYSVEQNGSNRAAVFPTGSRVGDGDEIEIPGIGTLEVGDEIHGGGGEVAITASPVDVPDGCGSETVLVFEAR